MRQPGSDQPGAACFVHGLESSSAGTKGRWLAERYPHVRMRDYDGDLDERLAELTEHVADLDRLVLVGSSFGGLVVASFAARHPARCRRLVLLAPALSWPEYRPPPRPLDVEALVVLGSRDTVCPPDVVVPLARASFLAPDVRIEDDDHLLHRAFPLLDWRRLLG